MNIYITFFVRLLKNSLFFIQLFCRTWQLFSNYRELWFVYGLINLLFVIQLFFKQLLVIIKIFGNKLLNEIVHSKACLKLGLQIWLFNFSAFGTDLS